MESIIPVLGVIFFLVYFANKLNKKDSDDNNISTDTIRSHDETIISMHESAHESAEQAYQHMENQKEQNQPDTLDLMFKTLNNLGCQPTKNDDGTLTVSYQGENFHMEFGGMYARVWDPMWAGIKADDPDMPKIREAVNATNFNFGPTVVLTAPDDEGVVGFHSRRDIMLHPACPDNEPFVKAVLDSFFDAKEQVRSNFQQINAEQMEMKKKRRPIGFATYNKN
jgi:hypothetical protein